MGYAYLPKIIAFAERASSWKLHLQVLSKMLNLQTAHANYLRCIHLYLQEIRNLPQTDPWFSDWFVSEELTVRGISKSWTRIWTDLPIEQTLMRSIKRSGGLTVGRGMTENIHHKKTLSLNHSASVNNAMAQLKVATSKSRDQHHTLGASRTKKK